MRIAVVFVGALRDGGFNESALEGAERAQSAGLAQVEVVTGLAYDDARIRARLEAVADGVDGVVVVGGQGDRSTPAVAEAHPETAFATVQGAATGPNLAAYDVRQEESAFLAGCLAAWTTRSGVVAHLSGHRVTPGLKGRAGFVAGLRHADPEVRVLTAFCGTQDDAAIARRWAEAQIAAGADVMFTMLNGARQGATDACRAGGARQIGNARNWVAVDAGVFVGSAVARIDVGVERAIADMAGGRRPARRVELGLADGAGLVELTLAPDVPADIAARIDAVAEAIARGTLAVPAGYDGPEFAPEGETCAWTA